MLPLKQKKLHEIYPGIKKLNLPTTYIPPELDLLFWDESCVNDNRNPGSVAQSTRLDRNLFRPIV